MKDFDFDELDKAVSSVLKKKPEPEQVQPADAATSQQDFMQPVVTQDVRPPAPSLSVPDSTNSNSDVHDSPSPSVELSTEKEEVVVTSSASSTGTDTGSETEQSIDETSEVPVTQPPVARPVIPQRRGRFMDMVHPSHDMQNAQAKPFTRQSARHSGVVPAPSAAHVAEPVQEEVASFQASQSSQSSDEPSTFESTLDMPKVDETPKPGLDDLQETQSEPDTGVVSNEAASYSEALQPEESELLTEDQESTLEKQREPFIEGAAQSVEKRPLGGYTPQTEEDHDETMNTESDTSTSQDVDSSMHEIKAEETAPEAATPHTDFGHQIPEQSSSAATATGPSPFISPQYKAQEEPVDGEEHAVFDTSNYHQPLHEQVHSTKKHTIFWIILILALFVGGAALGALYFLSMN